MRGIYTVKRKDGTAIYINFTPKGARRVRELVELVPEGRKFAKRLAEAERRAETLLTMRKAAAFEGRHSIARPQASMTLRQYVDRHYADELRERKGGLRTAEKEIQRLTTGPVGRSLGGVKLSELTEWRVRKYVKERRDAEVGPGAINRDLARLSNLWASARKRKLVSGDNPLREVGRLGEPTNRVRFLPPEDEPKLLAQLEPGVRRLAEVALHTGIRQGALFGLRWRDVDFQLGQVVVPDTLSKSRRSYIVPMNRRVRELLVEVRDREAFTGPDDLVFCKADGSARKSVRTAWGNACRRAGIDGLHWHDLRHTSGSRIVMGGGSIYDVKEHLGHRSIAMAERYAHLSADHRARVADLTLAGSVTSLSRERAARVANRG